MLLPLVLHFGKPKLSLNVLGPNFPSSQNKGLSALLLYSEDWQERGTSG
jgi:hypothetical protein